MFEKLSKFQKTENVASELLLYTFFSRVHSDLSRSEKWLYSVLIGGVEEVWDWCSGYNYMINECPAYLSLLSICYRPAVGIYSLLSLFTGKRLHHVQFLSAHIHDELYYYCKVASVCSYPWWALLLHCKVASVCSYLWCALLLMLHPQFLSAHIHDELYY